VTEWIVDGKRYSLAEYEVYRKEKEEQEEQAREKARRLIHELGEAYQACSEAMAQLPKRPFEVMDAEAQEHKLYQKLRENLERADGAPRCERVREDGTVCGCPQMRGYRYCYAHERMLRTRSSKLELPALEDANGIQMAIMRVQKALIDDEISEQKARLLLSSLRIAVSNLKHTTFTSKDKEVVTEMKESPSSPTSRVIAEIGESLPRIGADQNPLPQINADERRSGKSQRNGRSQPRAAVPHEHRVGLEL
jgi:hypothetical protein